MPGLKSGVRNAQLLAGGESLRVEAADKETLIHLPAAAPDPVVTVIRIELVP